MDQETIIFIEGIAAVASAVIVFCGSVWLLLMLVMGGKLAYFVTASVTLGVLLIMGVVWSTSELGPVGELPSWSEVSIGEQISDLDFAEAADFPDDPWETPNPDDRDDAKKKGEVESAAPDVLEAAVERGDVTTVEDASATLVNSDATRLLEKNGVTYGAVTFNPATGDEVLAVAILERDPGNSLGPPRKITMGILLLFLLHLFGLSRIEKRAKASTQPAQGEA
jgi:hypothetical protein